ncbi:MAG TPA: DUF4252 domain-containing protein [Pyrinomonadaceae bacterium]|nr:DUF4252 domain-containing protein [Pyrinomonadaceae bacterium]
MKSLFHHNYLKLLLATLLLTMAVRVSQAQTPRLQLNSLDHLSAKASETVDVNIDERLIQTAIKIFSDQDPDEREIKKLVSGLKGIYVKSFEFDNENEYSMTDLQAVHAQLQDPAWSRIVNVSSKKDGNIEVYLRMLNDQIIGLAVLSAELKELTIVNLIGPVDLEKLTRLEGHLGIPELRIESTKPKTKNEQ